MAVTHMLGVYFGMIRFQQVSEVVRRIYPNHHKISLSLQNERYRKNTQFFKDKKRKLCKDFCYVHEDLAYLIS